ncbi:TLC domain-containing protein 2, partial [Toxocara canis]
LFSARIPLPSCVSLCVSALCSCLQAFLNSSWQSTNRPHQMMAREAPAIRYAGSEMHMPPIAAIFDSAFFIPFVAFFVLFHAIGYLVRTLAWRSYSGFRQYRLRNLTVCLIHSIISGGFALSFMLLRPEVMFEDTLYWYEPWSTLVPILSIAYFICDAIDMLKHEISKWTLELLLHHVVSIFVFSCAVLPRRFIPYAYWALLMEVNSVFLHLRSLMQITGNSMARKDVYRVVRLLNVITFVVFRFTVQVWQINWAWQNQHRFHIFYTLVGVLGGCFFFITNIILFMRVLASDGFLGEYAKSHTAINRDGHGSVRIMQDTKNS